MVGLQSPGGARPGTLVVKIAEKRARTAAVLTRALPPKLQPCTGLLHVIVYRRRNGPPRPDSGPQRTVQRRPEPGQGQPRRGRVLRRQRQAAAAGLRAGG